MNKNLQDTTLRELLPASIAIDKNVVDIADSLALPLGDITVSIPLIELYTRIDELPEDILAMLAWENKMTGAEWIIADTIEARRELVNNSFLLNVKAGSLWAVKRIFELLQFTVKITEWFQEGAIPGTFRISVLDGADHGVSFQEFALMDELLASYKPLTRHLTGINVEANPHYAPGHLLACVRLNGIVESRPATVIEPIPAPGHLLFAFTIDANIESLPN